MGMEAMSRGAEPIIFVELVHKNCRIIQQNIGELNFDQGKWQIVRADAIVWLRNFEPETETILFASPPYIENLLPKVLA
ncbi:hypothetical protein DRQ33_07840, partial [bacterium]